MSISPGEDENADAGLQQHGNEQDVRMWRSLRFRNAEFEARYVADMFASTRTESIAMLIFGSCDTLFLVRSSSKQALLLRRRGSYCTRELFTRAFIKAMPKTLAECLSVLGTGPSALSKCDGIDDEFSAIKRAYFKSALRTHPDKGGDAAAFRRVQTAFEVLRDIFEKHAVASFATSGHHSTDSAYDGAWENSEGMPTPSWEFYYAAADEPVPLYKVEPAKSGRSKCKQKGSAKKCPGGDSLIPKGALRVGSLESMSGTYGRWHRLACWRVPSKIWLGLPNPDDSNAVETFSAALSAMNEVLLCGFNEMSSEDKTSFCEHVMKRENWARLTKRSSHGTCGYDGEAASSASAASGGSGLASMSDDREVVPQGYHKPRERFALVPGIDGARPQALDGQTVVLTGVFPEVGGGTGLTLGKERVKKIVQSFGGRVTSSVSGKTTMLIVGKNPGFSKVSKARAKPNVRLMSLRDLKIGIEGRSLEDAPSASQPLKITNFSAGYGRNGLAACASSEALAIASGRVAPKKAIAGINRKRRKVGAPGGTGRAGKKKASSSKRKKR